MSPLAAFFDTLLGSPPLVLFLIGVIIVLGGGTLFLQLWKLFRVQQDLTRLQANLPAAHSLEAAEWSPEKVKTIPLWKNYCAEPWEAFKLTLQHTKNSTQSISNFLPDSVLVDDPSWTVITRHVPSILTSIGIFTTFIGLYTGLSDFKSSSDPASLQGQMSVLILAVSAAFIGSLVAIGLATLSTAIDRSWTPKLYRLSESIRNSIDSFYNATQTVDELTRTADATSSIANKIGSLESFLDELQTRNSESVMETLDKFSLRMESFGEKFSQKMEDFAQEFREGLQSDAELFHEKTKQEIKTFNECTEKSTSAFAENTRTTLNTLNAATTATLTAFKDSANTTIETLSAATKTAIGALTTATNHFDATAEKHRIDTEKSYTRISKLIEEASSPQRTTHLEITHQLTETAAVIKELKTAADSTQERLKAEMLTALSAFREQTLQTLAETAAVAKTEDEKRSDILSRIFRDHASDQTKLQADTFQQLQANTASQLQAFQTALTSHLKTFQDSLSSSSSQLSSAATKLASSSDQSSQTITTLDKALTNALNEFRSVNKGLSDTLASVTTAAGKLTESHKEAAPFFKSVGTLQTSIGTLKDTIEKLATVQTKMIQINEDLAAVLHTKANKADKELGDELDATAKKVISANSPTSPVSFPLNVTTWSCALATLPLNSINPHGAPHETQLQNSGSL